MSATSDTKEVDSSRQPRLLNPNKWLLENSGHSVEVSDKDNINEYIKLFDKLESAVLGSNFKEFIRIYQLIADMIRLNDKKILTTNCRNSEDSEKLTNAVILTCKHGKVKLLDYILSEESSVQIGELAILPSDIDVQGHNAFYYAMRCGETEVLDTLIHKWPCQYFDKNSEELEELLSDAYRELKLKNIKLSEQMTVYIVNILVKLRFFVSETIDTAEPKKQERIVKQKSGKKRNDKTGVSHETLHRIDVVLDRIEFLQSEYQDAEVDDIFVFVLKLIAKCIHVLKRELRATYCKIPWEEIEFYLTVFIKCVKTPEQEVNFFFSAILNTKKVLMVLGNFENCLRNVKNNINVQDMGTIHRLKRHEMIDQVIRQSPFSEEFYKVYEQLRDFTTLDMISKHLILATSVNAEEKYGQLIIIRSLQVVGEHLKNTVESPKLSSTTNMFLLESLPSHTAEVLKNLRDSLSHGESLEIRTEIEGKTQSFFSQIQNDLKKMSDAVTVAFFKKKVLHIRFLLKSIIHSNTIEEMTEFLELKGVSKLDALILECSSKGREVEKVEEFIKQLKGHIYEKTKYEQSIFDKIEEIIRMEKTMANFGNHFINGSCYLKTISEMIASGHEVHEVKRKARYALDLITSSGINNSLKDIPFLCRKIWESITARPNSKHDEVKSILWQINYIYECDIGQVNWIVDLQKQLKPITLKVKKQSIEMLSRQNELLQQKIQTLKTVFNKNFSHECMNENFSLYKKNKNLQSLTEMLVLDIFSILSSKRRLSDNPFFLYSGCPTLQGKNLRNHLAHENSLVNVLTSSCLNIFLCANAISNGLIESYDSKLDKIVKDEPLKMKHVCDQELRKLNIQHQLFSALKKGDISAAKSYIEAGADLKGRDINRYTAMHFAARGPDFETVKFVLDHDTYVDMESKDVCGQNALHVAAQFGRNNAVEYFIDDMKMSVDCEDDLNRTPLHLAAENGHGRVAEYLLSRGACAHAKDISGYTPLYRAVANNHVETSKVLLNMEVNADASVTEFGFTALHIAAIMGHMKMVDFLVGRGAEVNIRTDKGYTALHEATLNGQLKIVQRLIKMGANVMAKDVDGLTPLHIAAQYGWEDIANLLVEHGAEVNVSSYFSQQTPLHLAADCDYKGIVTLLLRNGANTDARWIKGYTPLHMAVIGGNYDVARLLVESTNDIDAVEDEGLTALNIAACSGNKNIINLLIQNGADVNAKNEFGNTALHAAASEGHVDILEILIANGADIDAKDDSGLTALHRSSMKGHFRIVDILVQNSANISDDLDNIDVICTPAVFAIFGDHADIFKLLFSKETAVLKEALFYACLCGNCDIVEYLIQQGFKVNEYQFGSTPLHWAVQSNHKDVTQILLREKADINAKDEKGKSALYYAVIHNFKDLVDVLVSNKAYVDFDLLCAAVSYGYGNILDILLKEQSFDLNIPYKINEPDPTETSLLMSATVKGHRSIVESLLAKGAEINGVTLQGNITPLMKAAYNGHYSIVTKFLSKGADVNFRDADGDSVLHSAARAGSVTIFELLLQAGADPSMRNVNNVSPIEAAIMNGHLNVVKFLIMNTDIDVNASDEDDLTLLHLAALSGKLDIVRYLVEFSADPRALTVAGAMPIHFAVTEGHKDIVEYFLDGHNSINERDSDEMTPLHYASNHGWSDLTKFLIENDADVDAQDLDGGTPTHYAASKGWQNVLLVLLESGSSYDMHDKYFQTPLQIADDEAVPILLSITELFAAVKRNSLSEVKACMEKGAVTNAKDSNGRTSLHYACWKGYKKIVNLLLETNANANAVDKFGGTPLHYATKYEHLDIVMALLSSGALHDITSALGKTPFEYSRQPSVINKLLDLVDRSFTAVKKGDTSILNDLICQDIDTVKAVVRSKNSEENTLVIVAVLNNFPGLDKLKRLLQDDILNFHQATIDECPNFANEASQLFHRAILLRRTEIFGPDDPSTLEARENMLEFLSYEEAFSELHDIYQKRLKAVGLDKETLLMKRNIAILLQKMGKYRESLEVYEEITPLLKTLLDSNQTNHTLVLSNQIYIVANLCELGENQKALELIHVTLEHIREAQTVDYSIYVVAQSTYGKVLHRLKKLDEAVEVYYKVYETQRQVLESDHVGMLPTLQRIGCILQEQGKYEHALETFWKALSILESAAVRNQLDELVTKGNISINLYAKGSYLEAYTILKDIVIPMADNLGESHSVTLTVVEIMKKIIVKYELVYRDGLNILNQKVTAEGDFERFISENSVGSQHIDNAEGSVSFYHFVQTGDEEGVRVLLGKGMDAFQVSEKGVTPLHIAATYGFEGIVRLLLQHMKQLNPSRYQDFIDAKEFMKGNTALHVARDVRMTRLLLVHGATYDVRNAAGESPMDRCENQEKAKLLRLVDECFNRVEQGYIERNQKLGHLKNDDFLAATRARNIEGYTLHQITNRAKFRNFACSVAISHTVPFSSLSSGGSTTQDSK